MFRFSHALGLVAAVSSLPLVLPLAHGQADGYDLYVSSRDTNSIKRYDGVTGAYLDDFIAPGSGGLSTTQEVAVGPDGRLYVSGRGTDAILAYDARTGAFLGPFTTGYPLDEPTKMTFGPDGLLYVSQWGQQQSSVARFDALTGAFIDQATEDLDEPMAHAWDEDGNLYVVSFGSRDVRRYTPAGDFIDVFIDDPALAGPVNLWFVGDGLHIIDWQTGSVRVYDADTGEFRQVLVSGMNRAEGWAYDPDGRLYIADWADDVVAQFDGATGAPLGVFARGGGLGSPNGLLFVERFADFRLLGPTAALEVTRGQSVEVSLQVTPDRDLAFDEPVTLSCVDPPAGVSCSFTPASVVPGLEGGSVQLTLDLAQSQAASRPLATGVALGLGAMLALFAIGYRTRRRSGGEPGQRPMRAPLYLGALMALAVFTSCGGEQTPPTVATVEIAGVAGDLSHSTAIVLRIAENL